MKSVLKLFTVLSFAYLAACSVDGGSGSGLGGLNGGLGSKPDAIKDQPVQGGINSLAWLSNKAVGRIQTDGSLLVSISGNGEVIDCNYTTPLKPGLLFTVPMVVGEYDFDMLRPDQGFAITWAYKLNNEYNNIVSDMNHISITSVTYSRLQGGLSAKFLDPSNTGTMNGKFEVTICR